MKYLYNCVYLLALLFTFPYWIYKALTTGKYRAGLWDKFTGATPVLPTRSPVVWFHAVSVGEVLLLRPVIDRLRLKRPDLQLVLSTTTNTGFDLAKSKHPDLPLFYFPLDFSWAVAKVLSHLKPTLVVLAELELWPNLLLHAHKNNVPVAVINTRLSERSFRGYRKIRLLLRKPLAAVGWWGVQTEVYADRLRQLLADDNAPITVTGSIKYDGAQTDRNNPLTVSLGKLIGTTPAGPLWVAGSTMWPEERIVLDTYLSLSKDFPNLRLAIVPRHAERFTSVAEFLSERGVDFQRRSQLNSGENIHPSILLVDTVGELSSLWGLASFGYVGGSMNCGRGGQSMIEPAAFGVPICFGPDTKNFRHTVEHLLAAGAAVVVDDAEALETTLRDWLTNPGQASEMGLRARAYILSQQGALESTLRGLELLLPSPRPLTRCA